MEYVSEIARLTPKVSPKQRPHYVSNAEFLAQYKVWQAKWTVDPVTGEDIRPQMPSYLGACIIKIATRLAYKGNFIGYSYREDMVGDAIENCSRMLHKFKPERSDNIFAYVTQICYNAFLRRIASEKKQTYIRGKMIEEMPLDELFDTQDHDGDEMEFKNHFIEYLRDNNFIDTTQKPGKKKKEVELAEETLERFFNEGE